MNYKPCNQNASPEVKAVLNYLSMISGKGIIIGQHTKTKRQEELAYIWEVTGKEPALCGFELLSYSPNIQYQKCGEECLKEVKENQGTLEEAWKWAEKKGLITFTWHWFSPMGGADKAFYAENTNYDASKAILSGTRENIALLNDLDYMAGILQTFQEKKIPILWRPFHEAEGAWFWWGSKGPEVAKQLYLIMQERFTKVHHLDNLIWVWNSPNKEGYVGDDACDVISRDMYPPSHIHTDQKEAYMELTQITKVNKIAAIAEIGTIVSVPDLCRSNIPWAWYMTWCTEHVMSNNYTSRDELIRAYQHDYAITLEELPKLY